MWYEISESEETAGEGITHSIDVSMHVPPMFSRTGICPCARQDEPCAFYCPALHTDHTIKHRHGRMLEGASQAHAPGVEGKAESEDVSCAADISEIE